MLTNPQSAPELAFLLAPSPSRFRSEDEDDDVTIKDDVTAAVSARPDRRMEKDGKREGRFTVLYRQPPHLFDRLLATSFLSGIHAIHIA